MEREEIKQAINSTIQALEPSITILRRPARSVSRLGVFASSFNPVTTAHIELMDRAARQYALAEVLALAGTANADKSLYDCDLQDRLLMLLRATDSNSSAGAGITSTPFFVDMIDPLRALYPAHPELFFIVGFDTFERILDSESRYVGRYHKEFKNRREALDYLLSRSHLIVAGRGRSALRDLRNIISTEPLIAGDRVGYLDLPAEVAEQSATDVRSRLRAGLDITGLVPPAVEAYIKMNDLYRTRTPDEDDPG